MKSVVLAAASLSLFGWIVPVLAGGGAHCGPHAQAVATTPRFLVAPGSPIHVGPMPGRPVAGDCNGDGRLDLVVACGTGSGRKPDPASGHAFVLLGDGHGGFAQAPGSPIRVGASMRTLALGDLDRDGDQDLVLAEHDSYAVTVLLGVGDGSFTPAPVSPVPAGAGARPHTHAIALADLDGDATLDLVTTNASDGSISILRGDGHGGFLPVEGSPLQAGRHPYESIACIDVDGDGALDLVVPDLHGDSACVLRNNGHARFRHAPGSPFALGRRPGYIALADFDGDGDADLAATHDDDPRLVLLLCDGQGLFTPAPGSPIRLAHKAWGIATGDFDRDGDQDLVLGSNRSPILLSNDGAGRWAPRLIDAGRAAGPAYVLLADFDRDGWLDLVTSNFESGDLSVLLSRR